ncbi:tail fiber assembly protein [Gallibacterium anatis]|uniref:DUF4376 domain-containing protein n=1 Tax=Gallibacterium anatis TaxID=750 RepID=UPI00254B14E8|nr:DUF4376 domain-containing protein [Gallibacterium anatis]WIM82264.1 DUF4376 domain-containing protein [Gallibacterium anatis]WIM82337.1 DUF4376 domain-containing protein [Gallibacterium anatis]
MTIQFNNDGFALTSGEVTVYIINNQGIYSHSAQEFVAEGTGLSAGAYLDAPPEPKDNFAIVRSDDGLRWEYEPDYRGQTYYNTTTGEAIIINELGEIPQNLTALKPLDTPCKWDGEKWVIDEDKQAELLAQQRNQIRTQINTKRDGCVNGGVYVPAIQKWVDTDEKGRATLVEIKADFDLNGTQEANGEPRIFTLICADNTAQPLDFDKFKAVWNAAAKLKEGMFENAYMHKILLEQAEKPLEYDWSIGWEKTFEEYQNEQIKAAEAEE